VSLYPLGMYTQSSLNVIVPVFATPTLITEFNVRLPITSGLTVHTQPESL
jgi:hypothetical protein